VVEEAWWFESGVSSSRRHRKSFWKISCFSFHLASCCSDGDVVMGHSTSSSRLEKCLEKNEMFTNEHKFDQQPSGRGREKLEL